MREDKLFEAIGEVDGRFVEEAREIRGGQVQPETTADRQGHQEKTGGRMRSRKKRLWILAAAVCLIGVVTFGVYHFWGIGRGITLSENSDKVRVSYVGQAPYTQFQFLLEWLEEEEIFAAEDMIIFRGTVMDIQNIRIDFNGDTAYRALATLQVDEMIRGDRQAGEQVVVLLPCPINDGIWVEDTEVISQLRVGMEGIFMPKKYDEDAIWQQNGATLCLADVAEYGFWDGERFAFLKTEAGIAYAKYTYEGLEPMTLEDVEDYIRGWIE